jgi:predicted Zn-dependent peptidase
LEARLLATAAPRSGLASDGGKPLPLAGPFGTRLISRRGEQVHLLLGTRCSAYAAPDRWALDLLNTLLGEGMSSRLFLELREAQGLAYDVHSYTARHRDSGAFAIYLATRPDQAAQGVRPAVRELRRVAEEGLEPHELERAKAQMEGRLALQTESSGGLSEFLGHEALLTGGLLSPEEVVERVREVREEEVVGLAEELLPGRSGWRMAAVGPIRDREGLEAALRE